MLELRVSSCLSPVIIAVIATIACVDAAIAIIAFLQLRRIHSRSAQLGWKREKVFHLIIGLSNLGYFVYFLLLVIATCNEWSSWSRFCSFIFMAIPEILLLAAFLLLLSYWIDLCHHANDEDDEGGSSCEALLGKKKELASSDIDDINQRCLPIPPMYIGSRQRIVILVTVVAFVIMIAFATLIWIGMGKNSIDSPTVARVYVDAFAIGFFLLGVALAGYGLRIYLKMSKVRSERASSEMWKVTGLASVSLVCFPTSALVAVLTDVPVLYLCHEEHISEVSTTILLFVYYLIGSSIPSAFVLWVMRELPPQQVTNKNEESRIVTFIRNRSTGVDNPQRWTNIASLQNKNSKASPI